MINETTFLAIEKYILLTFLPLRPFCTFPHYAHNDLQQAINRSNPNTTRNTSTASDTPILRTLLSSTFTNVSLSTHHLQLHLHTSTANFDLNFLSRYSSVAPIQLTHAHVNKQTLARRTRTKAQPTHARKHADV